MSVINVTKDNFKSVTESGRVLLDFWAEWCPPCRMQSPVVDEIAEENPDIKVGKVNVDEQPELAAAFEVENIPTLIIFKEGQTSGVLVGLRTKEQLLDELK